MALAANAFNRAASADVAQTGGTVRLTAGKLLGVEILPPMLRRLRQQHPQLALELNVSNRLQTLSQQEADIAVRIRRPTEASVVAQGRRSARRPVRHAGIAGGAGRARNA
jgi:DNA-binding transcriptional LysR family regulator